jgi:endonuclease YncB( thermonuclease family)
MLLSCVNLEAKWETLENCMLNTREYHDGDSFHIRRKGKDYIFRLYFVDTPETDEGLEDRIAEQADYWGIDEKNTVKLGKRATQFSHDLLEGRQFTVFTEKKKARGRSKKQRYFAMVRVGDTFLSESLVGAGLARIYGKMTDLPDGQTMEAYLDTLQGAERQAKKKKLGAWNPRSSKRALRKRIDVPHIEEQELTLDGPVGIYSLKNSGLVGVLRAGRSVMVLKAESFSMVRIRFDADGKQYEAQCRRQDLGL